MLRQFKYNSSFKLRHCGGGSILIFFYNLFTANCKWVYYKVHIQDKCTQKAVLAYLF